MRLIVGVSVLLLLAVQALAQETEDPLDRIIKEAEAKVTEDPDPLEEILREAEAKETALFIWYYDLIDFRDFLIWYPVPTPDLGVLGMASLELVLMDSYRLALISEVRRLDYFQQQIRSMQPLQSDKDKVEQMRFVLLMLQSERKIDKLFTTAIESGDKVEALLDDYACAVLSCL